MVELAIVCLVSILVTQWYYYSFTCKYSNHIFDDNIRKNVSVCRKCGLMIKKVRK